jgi:hypothetical protein
MSNGSGEAVHDILTNFFARLVACILRVARREVMSNFRRESVVTDVLQHVIAELGNTQQAMSSMSSAAVLTDHDSALDVRTRARHEQLKLARTILESSSLLHCLGTPEVIRSDSQEVGIVLPFGMPGEK